MTDITPFKKSKKSALIKSFAQAEFFSGKGPGVELHYEFFKNFNSQQTREAYKADLKSFFEFFNEAFVTLRHPKQVRRSHIVAYKEFLTQMGGKDGEPAAPKTIGRKIGSLNSYFKFLLEKDIIKLNPVEGVKRPRQEVKSPTLALTDDQTAELLKSLGDSSLKEATHKAMLYILFATGIRVSEMINLKRTDFGKVGAQKVIRFKSKGGKFRVVPLRHEVVRVIDHYLWVTMKEGRKHKKGEYLFRPSRNNATTNLNKPYNRSTIYRIIGNAARGIGIFDKISPHSARATLISSLIEKGVDLYKVSHSVGHSSPQTTKAYDKRGKKLEDSALLEVGYLD